MADMGRIPLRLHGTRLAGSQAHHGKLDAQPLAADACQGGALQQRRGS
jgi:hypothetical protein